MKKLTFILSLLPYVLLSQDYAFEVDKDEGAIEYIYVLSDNNVFKISNSIDEVYIFNEESTAREYLKTLDEDLLPKDGFQDGGQDGGISIFIDNAIDVDYYTATNYYGSKGQIESINNITFTYVPDYSYNESKGTIGNLTSIGGLKITHIPAYSYNIKAGKAGKLESIGDKDFEYEPWSTWGEGVGMVGVPTKAGAIDIKYYETDYHDGFKGKVRSIGNIEFTYYGNTYTNKNADIVGKFESQTGNDTRLVVH